MTSPMGWNSWDCYGAAVTEEIVRRNADYMAEHLKEYGWNYVVVDIQWSNPTAPNHEYQPYAKLCTDEYSRLMPAPERFPSAAGGAGFKPLADYVHSLGLKFGIHIMRGIPRQAVHMNTPIAGGYHARDIVRTDSICMWNTDMYGVDASKSGARDYYESLFSLYADWGVDFIKLDDIAREMPDCQAELTLISECLRNCGRDMIFSISPGPSKLEYAEYYKQVANMWRLTDDFWDNWSQLYEMFEICEKWSIHTGDKSWPDPDMLPIGALLQDYSEDGWTKFTEDEQRTMMTLWCIMRAPLMIGGELTKVDDFTTKLVTCPGILGMHCHARHSHQVYRRYVDSSGHFTLDKSDDGSELIIWTATCDAGGTYIAAFNAGETDISIDIPLSTLEIPSGLCRNLWTEELIRTDEEFATAEVLHLDIRKHDAAAYLFI